MRQIRQTLQVAMLVACLATGSAWARQVSINELRVDAHPAWDKTRVYVRFDAGRTKAPSYQLQQDDAQQVELMLDCQTVAEVAESLVVQDEVVKHVQLQRDGNKTRVKVALHHPVTCESEYVKRHRALVLSFEKPVQCWTQPLSQHRLSALQQAGFRIVMLDPGHGGPDTGTQTRTARIEPSLLEKDVVLDLCRRMQARLFRQGGIIPVMTREGDYLCSLDERVEMARDYNCDLFVSVHCNWAPNKRARGFEAYTLSEGSRQERTATQLLREHHQEALSGVQETVAQVLINKQKLAVNCGDVELAGYLLARMDELADLPNRGHKRANFAVLRHFFCPSVLIEAGFFSNIKDAMKFTDERFRQQLADRMAEGIIDYLYHELPVTPREQQQLQRLAGAGHLTYQFGPGVPLAQTLLELCQVAGVTSSQLHLTRTPRQETMVTVPLRPIMQAPRALLAPNQTVLASSQPSSSALMVALTPGKPETHRVRQGETLWELARQYGTSVAAIKAANRLRNNHITPGDRLLVPSGGIGGTVLTAANYRAPRQPAKPEPRQYAVRSGDTLWEIADRANTTVGAIRSLNGLKSNTIKPGQSLLLPAPSDRARDPVLYTVKKGDSLWKVAQRFGADHQEIMRTNRLGGSVIVPGQQLKIPH